MVVNYMSLVFRDFAVYSAQMIARARLLIFTTRNKVVSLLILYTYSSEQ